MTTRKQKRQPSMTEHTQKCIEAHAAWFDACAIWDAADVEMRTANTKWSEARAKCIAAHAKWFEARRKWARADVKLTKDSAKCCEKAQ